MHSSDPSDGEKENPALHATHLRSADAEPATSRPSPAAHVDHVAQLSVLSVELMPDLNVPASQGEHLRSLVEVAAVTVKEPVPQGVFTELHSAPLTSAENVAPATHAAHVRSFVAEPGVA